MCLFFSGATVKTSLLFLKKFSEEEDKKYNDIKKEVVEEINIKYQSFFSEAKMTLQQAKQQLQAIPDNIKQLEKQNKESNNKKIVGAVAGGVIGGLASDDFFGGLLGAIGGILIGSINNPQKSNQEKIESLKELETKLKEKIKELGKEEKKKLKELEKKKKQEITAEIKAKLDYEIPIAEIKEAGITTTGQQGNNELPKLLEIFENYRRKNKFVVKTMNALLHFIRYKSLEPSWSVKNYITNLIKSSYNVTGLKDYIQEKKEKNYSP